MLNKPCGHRLEQILAILVKKSNANKYFHIICQCMGSVLLTLLDVLTYFVIGMRYTKSSGH